MTSVKLTDLYKRLDGIVNASKEVQNLTNVAKGVINQAEVNITASDQILDQAKKILMVSIKSHIHSYEKVIGD